MFACIILSSFLHQKFVLREDRKRHEAKHEEIRKAQKEKRKKQEELEVSS